MTLAVLAGAIVAFAGPQATQAGFEFDDGNLAPQAPIDFDWNSFAPTTWTGTAPTRTAEKTVSGWAFTGLEDADATTSDTAFAGGTKQDDDCASVITAKAPNKDDLKRVYVASSTVGGDVFLSLAWVRIPQNTTSPSAHIGFEFNQGSTACPAGSNGLVRRTAGDMLVVYDFEGGATDTPTISLRRWLTDPDDPDQVDFFTDPDSPCDVDSKAPPCWGDAVNLTAQGDAEARVNTSTIGEVTDANTPPTPPATQSVSSTLGVNEFGEAGINLTDAGVFDPNECTAFGKAYAVSRSSGNSGTAQMKDLVGPGNINLQNCGTVTIIKQTDPRGLNQAFSYTSNLAGAEMSCAADTTPASFTLNDTGNAGKTPGSTAPAQNSAGNTETCTNVPAGSYTVTEGADPPGFAFDSLTCTATGTGTSVTTAGKQASITMAGGGNVTCLYVNKQQLGAIKIIKTSSKSGNRLAGATFSITKGGTAISGSPFTTDSNGEICVSNLAFGDYVVTETGAPTGFVIDDPAGRTITVDNNASCSDATYVGESTSFTDTPFADIQVRFRDGGSGETALDQPLSCTGATTGTSSTADTTGWDDTLTISGIKISSSIVTVTCTIAIDP